MFDARRQRHDAFSDRVLRELSDGVTAQLLHKPSAVGFYGFRTNPQRVCDFLGAAALRVLSQDVHFSGGERSL